ncbi:hypothetical protein B0T12DRAFT_410257 [Alternaria alternata]|nr:hypothetical protein B0T12DRAFT_410257 [Alternaria alternata]
MQGEYQEGRRAFVAFVILHWYRHHGKRSRLMAARDKKLERMRADLEVSPHRASGWPYDQNAFSVAGHEFMRSTRGS